MKTNLCRVALAMLCAGSMLSQGQAALKSAKVSDYKGDVTVSQGGSTAQPVKINSPVTPSDVVRTGPKSLAELEFNDKTLTRLGANTIFSYSPKNREFEIQSGTALLQVPPGLGGAKIETAAVTAAITGTTVMVQKLPSGVVKLMVLEGSMNATLKGSNQMRSIKAGQMLIVPPNISTLPQPIVINVATVMGTSKLVQGFKTELTSEEKINKTVAQQEEQSGSGGLKSGGVVITTAEDLASIIGNQVLTSSTFDSLTQSIVEEGVGLQPNRGSVPNGPVTVGTGSVITPTVGSALGKLTTSTGQVIPALDPLGFFTGGEDYEDLYGYSLNGSEYESSTFFALNGPVTFTGQLPSSNPSSELGGFFLTVLGTGLQPNDPALSFIGSTNNQRLGFEYLSFSTLSGAIVFNNSTLTLGNANFFAAGNVNIQSGTRLTVRGESYVFFGAGNDLAITQAGIATGEGYSDFFSLNNLSITESQLTVGDGYADFYAQNDISLNGSTFLSDGSGSADFTSGRDLLIGNGSSITLANGPIELNAGRNFSMSGSTLRLSEAGSIYAGNDLSITGGSTITERKGTVNISSEGSLKIDGSTVELVDLTGTSSVQSYSAGNMQVANSTIGGNQGQGNSVNITSRGNIGVVNSLIGGSGISSVSLYAYGNKNLTILNSQIIGNTVTLGGATVSITGSVVSGNSISIYTNNFVNGGGNSFSTTPSILPYTP